MMMFIFGVFVMFIIENIKCLIEDQPAASYVTWTLNLCAASSTLLFEKPMNHARFTKERKSRAKRTRDIDLTKAKNVNL